MEVEQLRGIEYSAAHGPKQTHFSPYSFNGGYVFPPLFYLLSRNKLTPHPPSSSFPLSIHIPLCGINVQGVCYPLINVYVLLTTKQSCVNNPIKF